MFSVRQCGMQTSAAGSYRNPHPVKFKGQRLLNRSEDQLHLYTGAIESEMPDTVTYLEGSRLEAICHGGPSGLRDAGG